MTREEKLQVLMESKGTTDLDIPVAVYADSPIAPKSFGDYEKTKKLIDSTFDGAAKKLGVSPNVFKGCDTDDVIELMETIFWIEANGENDVYIRDNKIVLDIPKLYPYLELYRIIKGAAETGAISNKAYLIWKLNWDKNTMPTHN